MTVQLHGRRQPVSLGKAVLRGEGVDVRRTLHRQAAREAPCMIPTEGGPGSIGHPPGLQEWIVRRVPPSRGHRTHTDTRSLLRCEGTSLMTHLIGIRYT